MKKTHIIVILIVLLGIIAAVFLSVYQPGLKKEVIGEFVIGPLGGQYNSKNVNIIINSSKKLKTADVKVYKHTSSIIQHDNFNFKPDEAYGISTDAKKLAGSMIVEFPIPEKILNIITEFDDLPNRLFIAAINPIYNPHQDKTKYTWQLLSTNFDKENMQAYSEINFEHISPLQFEEKQFEMSFLLVYFSRPVERILSSAGHRESPFFESIIEKSAKQRNISQVLKYLEEQKRKIHDLHFSTHIVNYPVPVYFRDAGDELIQLIKPCGLPDKSFLVINPKLLDNPTSFIKKNELLLDAQTGKSLIALIENFYPGNGWFSEALPVWYQPVATANAAFKPIGLVENAGFIQESLLFPDLKRNSNCNNFGKGAAFWLSFLQIKKGAFFAGKVQGLNNQLAAGGINQALEQAVKPNHVSNLYLEFIDVYTRNPEILFPGMNAEIIQQEIKPGHIKGKITSQGNSFDIDWKIEKLHKGNASQTGSGLLVDYELSNLEAACLSIDFPIDKDRIADFKKSKKILTIEVEGDAETGVYIYNNNAGKPKLLLPRGEYLSPRGRSYISMKGFSSLYFVFFNRNDNIQIEQPARIKISFNYGRPVL